MIGFGAIVKSVDQGGRKSRSRRPHLGLRSPVADRRPEALPDPRSRSPDGVGVAESAGRRSARERGRRGARSVEPRDGHPGRWPDRSGAAAAQPGTQVELDPADRVVGDLDDGELDPVGAEAIALARGAGPGR